jgi:hypothetical protein
MTYIRNTWVNKNDPSFNATTDPAISAANLNSIEQGIVDAHTHIDASNNPHSVTASQVGLGNVTNAAQLTSSQLETTITDDDGKVPSSGAVVDYVAGRADMLKSAYDTNADGKVNSADSADAVPWTGVSGKPSAYPPESHNHDGSYSVIGHAHSGTYEPVISTKKTAFNVDFGTATGTACQGNDPRLGDARTPSSHNNSAHSETYITASGVTYEALYANGDIGSSASTLCAGDDLRLSNSRSPISHGNEAHSSTFISSSGVTYEALNGNTDVGTGSDQVAAGNHNHDAAYSAISHNHLGVYADASHNHGGVYEPVIALKGTAFNTNFGTSVGTTCQGNDSRLGDPRTPVSHSHTYSDISSLATTVTDDDTKIPTSGAIVDYVNGNTVVALIIALGW